MQGNRFCSWARIHISLVGFSDAGTPAMMDSLGMLSLYPHASETWIPFCDTTKHVSHIFVKLAVAYLALVPLF